ncbi:MAG: NADH-quinone oxidoreductase subunit N [Bacteroidia bacterium]|nr:NADH-quinone oxidoreductase subunit N [Bacteroidia bacterium]
MNALIILSSVGLLALLAELGKLRSLIFPLVVLGMLATIVASVIGWGNASLPAIFNNMIRFDNYAAAFTILICFMAIIWYVMSNQYIQTATSVSDHFVLTLFAITGAVVLVSFNNLTMFFLGVEILSIPVYVLAGSKKDSLESNESAFKYFLMGAFASAFLLFGLAFLYGATGSLDLQTISNALHTTSVPHPGFLYAGVLLIVAGLSFKVSLAPFHTWAPDVYTGAPTPVTAFMATIVKTAAFAAFFRLMAYSMTGVNDTWMNVLMVLSALSLIIGNVTAVYQQSVKRMLAWSGVSHAGFMVMAIIAMNIDAVGALFYYAAAYALASFIAFTALIATGFNTFDQFNGLAKKSPLLAFSLTVGMLSLAGIPPVAGFFAKYSILSSLLQLSMPWHVLLAVVGILGSLVGVYYYFRLIICMYYREPDSQDVQLSVPHRMILLVCVVFLIALGIYPDLLLGIEIVK